MAAEYIPELISSGSVEDFNVKIKKFFKDKGDRIEKVMFSTNRLGNYSMNYSALVIYSEGEDDTETKLEQDAI